MTLPEPRYAQAGITGETIILVKHYACQASQMMSKASKPRYPQQQIAVPEVVAVLLITTDQCCCLRACLCLQSLNDAGWTQTEVYNIPNALSLARLVSGPGIAWLILNEHWGLALGSLVISGASDWADGSVLLHHPAEILRLALSACSGPTSWHTSQVFLYMHLSRLVLWSHSPT